MSARIVAGPYVLRFASSYRGESDYTITGPGFGDGGALGARVHVRQQAADDGHYTAGAFDSQVRPLVGTVRVSGGRDWPAFPPAEVLEAFPGFVGARWNLGAFEFTAPARQWVDARGEVWAVAWREELRAHGLACSECFELTDNGPGSICARCIGEAPIGEGEADGSAGYAGL